MNTPTFFPWVALALGAHGAAWAAADRHQALEMIPTAPLEVELAASAEPEAPPPPAQEPAEEGRVRETLAVARPPIKTAARSAATVAPSPAVAAKVGALLTSGEAVDSADSVAFLSDPNGGAYGSGVVARGATAEHGIGPTAVASVAAALPEKGRAEAVTPAANLSRAPSLDDVDACRGFFPTEAAADRAVVDLVVIVQAGGRVTAVTLARESPAGEGFGAAARACLLSKRFAPGADRAGRAVTASAAVRVHFTR